MKFSLIIPCYNEAAGLADLVAACADAGFEDNVEVILVDNGSTDETPDLLKQLLKPHENLRSVRVDENQGYGFGILSGLRAAKGDILGWTHADLQTDPADFRDAMAFFNNGDDVFVKGKDMAGRRPTSFSRSA